MWLGSKHQVAKVTMHDIPVMQSSMTTVNTARDLGVMLDSQLTVGTSRRCVSISIQLSSPVPPCRSSAVGRSKEDSSPRICVFTPRLLQLSVVRCYRQPGSTSSSCSKCCSTSRRWHSPIRAHHASKDNFTGYQYGNVLNLRWLFWANLPNRYSALC